MWLVESEWVSRVVPELFISAGALLWGIIRRAYVWAPTILLDAADYQERYIEPHLGWSIDLPAEVFPIALTIGLFMAVVLTYHDVRSKEGKPDVVFEVRESIFSLNSYNRSRPKQPFDMADVTLKGRLRNRGDVRTDINGVRVALMGRGWLWAWRKVDEQPATMLLNRSRAKIDLYYHEVSVDAQSSSWDIAEIWAYIPIPLSLKPSTKRAHRLRIFVDAYGRSRPSPMYESVDVLLAFRIGLADHRRRDLSRGRSSESAQNTEGSPPQ